MRDIKISQIPIPKVEGEIENEDLHKLLKAKLPQALLTKVVIYLVDQKYQLTDRKEMERFLTSDKTDLFEYVPEYYDCDDFSFRLMGQVSIPGWAGIAFGIAFSNNHAFNLFVDSARRIFVIEPQGNEIWPISAIPKKYKKYFTPIRFVLM